MKTVLSIFGVIVVVIFAYILLMGVQPAANEIIQTVNATANWTGHEDYALAQDVMLGSRLWVWFVPGGIGVACTAFILLKSRKKER